VRRRDRIRRIALGAAGLAALFVWLGSGDERGVREASTRDPNDARRAARGDVPRETDRTQGRGREAGDAADAYGAELARITGRQSNEPDHREERVEQTATPETERIA